MNAMLSFGGTETSPSGQAAFLLEGSPGVAICSNCRQVVPAGQDDGLTEAESVLLDTACPRCGEAAMRLAHAGIWD